MERPWRPCWQALMVGTWPKPCETMNGFGCHAHPEFKPWQPPIRRGFIYLTVRLSTNATHRWRAAAPIGQKVQSHGSILTMPVVWNWLVSEIEERWRDAYCWPITAVSGCPASIGGKADNIADIRGAFKTIRAFPKAFVPSPRRTVTRELHAGPGISSSLCSTCIILTVELFLRGNEQETDSARARSAPSSGC